ncbi:hypothetical protein BV98_002736 [Sphingobium herbicidovorans NBRC 16415]|uniref:Lipoprotein n=1 Tax=Sphingobium herbicidovorans (strain ATCC 700291 / DSM 11019 / CCUG 56400 / KCTC 2939 / LMG 18315 / NBRC 16415 / MH) TaxID=1219045 RepID=A0A086P7V4_SPHHM|nr:hypothetical protein [Sphingobium herbicidovorans]KFG89472.1 hypothetical protein BV98_002736 [Sphingobium herbicidovorans NBRC 16415]
MKISPANAATLGALTLTGCNHNPADSLDDRVKESAEARAHAISAADRNVAATMSEERRETVVANEAPAVR